MLRAVRRFLLAGRREQCGPFQLVSHELIEWPAMSKKRVLDPYQAPSSRRTGSRSRTRTCDMVVNSHPLYRLSYPGMMVLVREYGELQGGKIPYTPCSVNGFFPSDDAPRPLPSYPPSWPFFSSMMTSLATALSVSKTPPPSEATASKSGTPRGFRAFRISGTGTALGRSRLLYWTT